MKRALFALLVVLIALGAGAAFYVQSQRAHQSRAFARLEQRDLNGARGDLIALRGRTVWFPVITQEEAARRLFARGAYDEYLAFAQSFRERTHSANALLYTVAALALTGRTSAADKLLAAVDRTKVDPKRYASVEAALRARRDGHVPYVFDRTGAAIGTFDLTARTLTADDRAFQPVLDAFISPKLGTDLSIETTIDSRAQRAAIAALGAYRGTLVAIDPRTNELLAIASANGATLDHQYEPGSVVKVLTGLNAIDSGVALTFPYQCTGALDIDGIRFGDWVPSGHGSLETIDEALAVSCNIVFADLGLRLGNDKLRAFMTKAGFDGQTDTGLGTIALGRIVPPLASRNDTAHFAIGLEHETVTPLHLAMLASMMANRGVLTSPRLLRARHTILGEIAGSPPEQGSSRIASERAATTMLQAMQAVVTDPRGTGRRAAVDGVTIAMKTGTAGSREKGYDALVMAFAPAESPKIAFSVIAENAGHAEVAGAQIAHDFVAAMFNAVAAVPAAARSESTGTPSVPAPAPAPPH
jgi:hypothetical protein